MRGLGGIVPLRAAEPNPLLTNDLRKGLAARAPLSLLDPASDAGVMLAADLQLHNAAELRATLGAQALRGNDEDLIKAAYERWGEDFVRYVVGDFAIAVLDRRRRRLLLACDFIGSRPLSFASTPDFVAFASEPAALASLPGVDDAPDDFAVVLSLMGEVGDGTHTHFRGVRRVPGGHLVAVDLDGGGVTTRRWWVPRREDLHLRTDAEYEEAFRSLLFEAVRCRLPIDGVIGTDLSGGLDSASVTAVAAALADPRPVVAIGSSFADPRFDDGTYDEGEHRRMLQRATDVDLVEVDAHHVVNRDAADEMIQRIGAPQAGVLLVMAASRYRALRERGGVVLLDGYDGDVSVNYGFQRMIRLLAQLRWLTARREFVALKDHNQASLKQAVAAAFWFPVHGWLRTVTRRNPIGDSVIRQEVIDSSGVGPALRSERFPLPGSSYREQRFHLLGGWAGEMMSYYDAAGTLAGVEVRHPYYDRRLVEFCLSLPENQRMREGWTRWIVRRAMRGVMPDVTRWRAGKGGISGDFVAAYADAFPIQDVISRRGGAVAHYLDPGRFDDLAGRWVRERRRSDAFALLAVAQVDRWLSR